MHSTLSFKFCKYIVNEISLENVDFLLIHSFIISIIISFCIDNHWLTLIIIIENEVIVVIIYNFLNRVEMLSLKAYLFDYVYCLRQRNIYFKTHYFRDDVRVEIFFQQKNNFSCDLYVIAHIIDLMNKHVSKQNHNESRQLYIQYVTIATSHR